MTVEYLGLRLNSSQAQVGRLLVWKASTWRVAHAFFTFSPWRETFRSHHEHYVISLILSRPSTPFSGALPSRLGRFRAHSGKHGFEVYC